MHTHVYNIQNLTETGSFSRIFKEKELVSIEGVHKVEVLPAVSKIEVDIEEGVSVAKVTKVLKFLGLDFS